MEFQAGECVVYPTHGVAQVESIQELSLGGTARRCYRLRMLSTGTTVMVPLENAGTVGLRRTIPRRNVKAILERLRDAGEGPNRNWKGRFQENTNRMRSGRLEDVVEVVRSLAQVAGARGLSFREKAMLERARELVIVELAIARGSQPGETQTVVDEALAAGLRA